MEQEAQPLDQLNKVKELFMKNRLLVLLCLSAVFLSVALIYKIFKTPDYAEYAEREYRHFLTTSDSTSLKKLASYVANDPSLHSQYSSFLARTFLDRGEETQGLYFLHKSVEPLKEISPYHAAYAKATILIAKANFDLALQETVQLKVKLQKDKETGLELYSSVLKRIALLEKKLGRNEQELLAWKELEENSGLSSQEKEFVLNRKKALNGL
jgi:hypothetical protein